MGDRDYGKAVIGYFIAGAIALICTAVIAQAGWTSIAGFGFIVSAALFFCGIGLFLWQQTREEENPPKEKPSFAESLMPEKTTRDTKRIRWLLTKVWVKADGSIHFPVQNSRIKVGEIQNSLNNIDEAMRREKGD